MQFRVAAAASNVRLSTSKILSADLNGDMQDRTTSSNDVIFLLHHAMIDGIWELWRQKQQVSFFVFAAFDRLYALATLL